MLDMTGAPGQGWPAGLGMVEIYHGEDFVAIKLRE